MADIGATNAVPTASNLEEQAESSHKLESSRQVDTSAILPNQASSSKPGDEADKLEGKKIKPKKPYGNQFLELKDGETSLEIESDIKASIIHFDKVLDEESYYFVPRKPTIKELVYESNPASYMKSRDEAQDRSPDEAQNPVPHDIRWIHIPGNNMGWVESVVRRIYKEKPEDSMASAKASLLLRPQFWSGRQYQNTITQKSAQGRFLWPLFSRVSTDPQALDDLAGELSKSNPPHNSVILMPYIHWEKVDQYLLRNKCLDWMAWRGPSETTSASRGPWKHSPNQHEKGQQAAAPDTMKTQLNDTNVLWSEEYVKEIMAELRLSPSGHRISKDAQLMLAYAHNRLPLHARRTLDQSFYHTLPETDIRMRDLDQVVYRHTKDYLKMENPHILMVDQLWLWVIEEPDITPTVLTAFPPRWTGNPSVGKKYDVSDVYTKIFGALNRGESYITSPADLVSLIVEKCASLFHPNEVETGLDYLEIFAIDIGRLADTQTRLANDLSEHSIRLVELERRRDELLNRWSTSGAVKGRIPTTQEKEHTPQEKEDTSKGRIQPFEASKMVHATPTGVLTSDSHTVAKDHPEVTDLGDTLHTPAAREDLQSFSRLDKETYRAEEWFANTTTKDLARSNLLEDLSPILERGARSELEREIEHEMDRLVDITEESRCFGEIKDILDELNSIANVFRGEIKIMARAVQDHKPSQLYEQMDDKMVKETDDNGKAKAAEVDEHAQAAVLERTRNKETSYKYQRVVSTLERRKRDIDDLSSEANRVYKGICDLLDLKQKQASVSEAYFARQEAKETAQQGQTILLFTIVTITFLPLSFIAAIYSMNAREINGYQSRPIKHVWRVMFPTTLGVLLISLIFAFNINIRRVFHRVFSKGKTNTRTSSTQAPTTVKQEPRKVPLRSPHESVPKPEISTHDTATENRDVNSEKELTKGKGADLSSKVTSMLRSIIHFRRWRSEARPESEDVKSHGVGVV